MTDFTRHGSLIQYNRHLLKCVMKTKLEMIVHSKMTKLSANFNCIISRYEPRYEKTNILVSDQV